MDSIERRIKQVFEYQINKSVITVKEINNKTNNCVYRIETENQDYIFKVYARQDWPEKGKLPFVADKLKEYNIPHAKIHAYKHDDENFPNGYLIEECLPGVTADILKLSADDTFTLFKKLAELTSRFHQIKLIKYGYTGDGGGADWDTFSEYMYDSLNDHAAPLLTNSLVENDEWEALRKNIYKKLRACDVFPSVLCHGDISAKNVLINADEITLIDWDDSQSLCFPVDVSRLTLWMMYEYNDEEAKKYRKTFLKNYKTEYDMNLFYETEDILHVWHGLGYLSFFIGKSQFEKAKKLLKESLLKCGQEILKCLY